MGTTSFESFDVYKKGVLLAREVFELLSTPSFDREYALKDQLKRAVISITNNIAEGSEYNNNRQFVRFLKMAKGSCAEVRSMLVLATELKLCEREQIQTSYDLTIEIAKALSNFIKYLNSTQKE
ncbi:MAG TPA: four helix bundle protein [Flavobacterium sp.]|nr:four helix bundle protein [Flavobacterium sp.]